MSITRQEKIMPKTVNALVFYSFATHKTCYINRLFAELEKAAPKHNIVLSRGSLKDLHFQFSSGSFKVVESLTNKDLTEFDVVYFELWQKSPQQALAAARYLQSNNIPFFSEELASFAAVTKLGEYAVLANNNLPIIDSYFTSNKEIKKLAKTNQLPYAYPFILKDIEGYGGNNNFLIHTEAELVQILADYSTTSFVMQPFVSNNGDYRLLVLGGEIKVIIERKRDSNTSHLNNTSQGAEGNLVDIANFPKEIIDDALKATKLLKRPNFAGVDVIINKETGKHYILEVNQTPQIEEGAVVDKKIKAMLNYIYQLGEKVGEKNA